MFSTGLQGGHRASSVRQLFLMLLRWGGRVVKRGVRWCVGVFADTRVRRLSGCAVRRRPVASLGLVRETTGTLAHTVRRR